MKKLLLVGALSIILSGCTSNEPAQEPDAPDEDTNSLEENSANTAPEDNSEAEEQASETDAESSELATYEEYSTITEVADVDRLNGIVETDNPGTRVILFEDESGKKTVKSVYVKKENRLKVISLDDDGLLYNDILK
ncbi:hypothetical protein DVB69_11960 [Sporosarcina sp. BI001-red]|uniref:hypothetical protein n=1 Tax=Sporosarcina sp. BI001-red TaxID=2282866 RepID=UPI000E26D338|nr:hypothetical protein [Sporosarcina sp. BI001-red]REB06417.1 hypothetical protein DVB69_11960 [Sporosarcina sp. BI001-red]